MTVSDSDVSALFAEFERSAVRLECQQTYTMPEEQEDVRRYLAGGPKPSGLNDDWHDLIRSHRAAGRSMQRIKVVRKPMTDYNRHLFDWIIPDNVNAGEDYLIIAGDDADELGIPDQDFWVFDDRTVLLLHFNADGTFRDRELANVVGLSKYLRWRDLALARAVPFDEYRA